MTSGFAKDPTTSWMPPDRLKSMSSDEIFALLGGDYRSVSSQRGWNQPVPMTQYRLCLSEKGAATLYVFDERHGRQWVRMFSLLIQIENMGGYLSAKTDAKSIQRQPYGGRAPDQLPLPAMAGWFGGMLSVSVDAGTIVFSNGLEVDGGPAITWKRDAAPACIHSSSQNTSAP